jgi:ABC-type Mn2+/Zn2+ transport system ATPase subunit
LVLEDVTVGYVHRPVLERVCLSLPRGSFTGLLGANGSGKSTLLKTVLGILRPLAGKVVLRPIGARPPVMGYVPQRESLDPIFLVTSLEVVLMAACGHVGPGRFFGRKEWDWARECLGRTGALELAHALFSELSGGQKQRVLVARALATRPDFLLLDEPIAGIDAPASQAILELLRQVHAQQQMTILLVSHDLTAVRQYARHVVWLHEGRVLQGPVEELLSRERIEAVLHLEAS